MYSIIRVRIETTYLKHRKRYLLLRVLWISIINSLKDYKIMKKFIKCINVHIFNYIIGKCWWYDRIILFYIDTVIPKTIFFSPYCYCHFLIWEMKFAKWRRENSAETKIKFCDSHPPHREVCHKKRRRGNLMHSRVFRKWDR